MFPRSLLLVFLLAPCTAWAETPAARGIVRTDAAGDPLPPGAFARLGTRRWRLPGAVRCVALSPDGRIVAAVGDGPEVYLWEAPSGRLRARLAGHNQVPTTLAFSADGRVLASGSLLGESTAQVRLWDTATGKARAVLPAPTQRVALAFSPDGRLLAGGSLTEGICLWDVATGREAHTINDRSAGGLALAFWPDGKLLASGTAAGRLVLYDVATGKQRLRLAGHRAAVCSVSFAPDGKTLVSGGNDRFIRFWDARSGKELHRLATAKDSTHRVAFAADGRTVVADMGERTLRRWDRVTGKELSRWRDDQYAIACVAFSTDGKFASLGSKDGPHAVRLVDLARGVEISRLSGHHGPVSSLAFSADGRSIATSSGVAGEGAVRLWDALRARERFRLPGRKHGCSVLFSPDGKFLVSVDGEGLICWWEPATGKEVGRRRAKGGIRLWYAGTGPDARPFVVTGKGLFDVSLVDAMTGKRLCYFVPKVANQVPSAIAVSPDGKRLVIVTVPFSVDLQPLPSALVLWDTATDKMVRRLPIDYQTADAVAISPDGRLLAVREGIRKVVLREVVTGKATLTLEAPHHVGVLAFSPDGRMLTSSGLYGNNSMAVWEVATGQERLRLRGPLEGDLPCAFSPDGRLLGTGCPDGTTLLWDLTGQWRQGKAVPVSARELESQWTDLAGTNAPRAYQSVWALALHPAQAVALIQKRIRPAVAPEARRVARLLTDLDSDDFAERQAATAELDKLGELVRPDLQRVLKGRPSLEVRRRVEHLLAVLDRPNLTPERLRQVRAVEVLEYAGTPEARRLLERLARGVPGARLTRESKAALHRLNRRRTIKP